MRRSGALSRRNLRDVGEDADGDVALVVVEEEIGAVEIEGGGIEVGFTLGEIGCVLLVGGGGGEGAQVGAIRN